jgi:hypothetical protein
VYSRRLALTAVAYVVCHHLGLLPRGLGAGPGGTRWADWLDLLVPWLVLGPAAATLLAAEASRRTWTVFGIGALAYASGHGIHLAANSVGNADPGPTAHLWDEAVGHDIWYAGVAVVAAALASTMRGRPRTGTLGYALGVAVGLTWASNALGATAGAVVLGLLGAVVAATYGWRHRTDLDVVLLAAGAAALVVLAGDLLVNAA